MFVAAFLVACGGGGADATSTTSTTTGSAGGHGGMSGLGGMGGVGGEGPGGGCVNSLPPEAPRGKLLSETGLYLDAADRPAPAGRWILY